MVLISLCRAALAMLFGMSSIWYYDNLIHVLYDVDQSIERGLLSPKTERFERKANMKRLR